MIWFLCMFSWKWFAFSSHFLSSRAVTTPVAYFFIRAGISLQLSETETSKEGINLLKMPRTASFIFILSFFFFLKSFREDPNPKSINRKIQRALWTWNSLDLHILLLNMKCLSVYFLTCLGFVCLFFLNLLKITIVTVLLPLSFQGGASQALGALVPEWK